MKIVTFGELMMRLTPPGYARLTQARSFEVTFGGAEANVAVSLACMGEDAEFVSKIPANDIGQAAVNSLRAWGVGTAHLLRGGERLGTYYMERGASQRPSKVVYDRAGSAVALAKSAEFDWDAILDGADWFHLTGITPALSAELANACEDACRTAKRKGVTVSFDPNYRAKLWSVADAAKAMRRYLPYVDVLITNENQAADLFGVRIPAVEVSGDDVTERGYLALAEGMKALYPQLRYVALTERRTFSAEVNSFCAKLYDGENLYSSEKYRMEIVDRVGGGDAFAAGLIYALRRGKTARDAVQFAAAASCLKHSVEGDMNPATVAEIEALANGNATGRVQR